MGVRPSVSNIPGTPLDHQQRMSNALMGMGMSSSAKANDTRFGFGHADSRMSGALNMMGRDSMRNGPGIDSRNSLFHRTGTMPRQGTVDAAQFRAEIALERQGTTPHAYEQGFDNFGGPRMSRHGSARGDNQNPAFSRHPSSRANDTASFGSPAMSRHFSDEMDLNQSYQMSRTSSMGISGIQLATGGSSNSVSMLHRMGSDRMGTPTDYGTPKFKPSTPSSPGMFGQGLGNMGGSFSRVVGQFEPLDENDAPEDAPNMLMADSTDSFAQFSYVQRNAQ